MATQIVVLYNDFPRIAANLPERTMQLAYAYAEEDLLPQARTNQEPHIDTGALNESGYLEPVGSKAVRVAFTGGALNRSGEPRIYAAFHEYGTRFTGAYPFLTPAADQTFPQGVYDRAHMLVE